jgi:hypothetical protein
MGSGSSSMVNETEQKVFDAIRGVILRTGRKTSLLQDFLSTSLPHAYRRKEDKNRFSSLYVVKDGKEMERFGLLPSLQNSPDRFIVRPLRKEYIDGTNRFRSVKTDSDLNSGIIAVYSVIASMLAITGMGLSSHTKKYKDLVEEITRDSTSITQTKDTSSNYNSNIIKALQTYSLQKHTRNINPRDRNIIFNMDNHTNVVATILKRIEGNILKKKSSMSGPTKGDVLLHTSILQAIDSFAICSRNPNSLKVVMNHLQKNGNLDSIIKTIQNLLSKDVVLTWFGSHQGLKTRLQRITLGAVRSARLVARNDVGLHEVISEISESMRKHVEDACRTNEMLSTYSSKKNVLTKSSGSDKYEYSKEANRMIVRIYQKFESITLKMQSEILKAFTSVFEISKTEIENTVNIQTTDGYISLKPGIVSSKDPGEIIMTKLLDMTEAYVKYIINLQDTLRATINRKTRIL